jgi:hypothetical protein
VITFDIVIIISNIKILYHVKSGTPFEEKKQKRRIIKISNMKAAGLTINLPHSFVFLF